MGVQGMDVNHTPVVVETSKQLASRNAALYIYIYSLRGHVKGLG